MQCSACQNYMAAAEATLRVGVEVRNASGDIDSVSTAPLPKANLRAHLEIPVVVKADDELVSF